MPKLLPEFRPSEKNTTIIKNAPEGYRALLLRELTEREGQVVYVAPDDKAASALRERLRFFAPELNVLHFPAWDCLPYDRVSPHKDVVARRLDTLMALSSGKPVKCRLVVTTAAALSQRVPPKESLQNTSRIIQIGDDINRDDLIRFLLDSGYSRRETVHEWGEFAVRGGIMDVFPAGQKMPLRLDFFGDEVETIRSFDPLTQVSVGGSQNLVIKPMNEVILTPESISRFRTEYRKLAGLGADKDPLYKAISEGNYYAGIEHWLPLFYDKLETLFDFLPKGVWCFDQDTEEGARSFIDQVQDYFETRERFKRADQEAGTYYTLKPESLYLGQGEWDKRLSHCNRIQFSSFNVPETDHVIDAGSKLGPTFAASRGKNTDVFEDVKTHLTGLLKKGVKPFVVGFTEGSTERLKHILEEHELSNLSKVTIFEEGMKAQGIAVAPLSLSQGFVSPAFAVITEEDILGERIGRQAKAKRKADMVIEEASSIEVGDYVVHADHGVGRYEGLIPLEIGGHPHDCLQIIYDGGDKLFLPVENIELLSRYGASEGTAQLDRLGGVAWQAKKAKARERIRIIAAKLMETAAERSLKIIEPVHKTEGLFDEFCARFPYAETEDQLQAVDDIVHNLASGKPMDRLVCGDVGFGKTEVAMRAAFLVASTGRQVALVVPTTLLARQHYNSFKARFEGTGVKIGQLSRLVTPKNAKVLKEDLAAGKVDIVIGTHALLAESVKFHDLGLLIVDEEQHFGVAQKEKLKALKTDIHILTLTATPIPRTLQLSLSGIREMSLITTPPVDRLAVRTFVMPFDGVVVREAIMREKFRGGQCFYVCPRIQDIEKVTSRLNQFVPEATFAVANGQMKPSALEEVMTDFCDGKYDILVATNIIESGIDISTANTMIIHRADMFGLSQLYQLRGRVGRSKLRGYCYLTLPNEHLRSENAQKRLEVMQSLDALGAGFTVASHDLDIRGAGNMVGDEQSGQIKEVGAELYQHMLEEAIQQMKDEGKGEIEDVWSPQINLGVAVLIPDAYVADLGLRLSLYRRLSHLNTREELDGFASELIDRFGPLPDEVQNLLEVVYLKGLAKSAGIAKIDVGPKGVVMAFHKNEFSNPAALLHYIASQKGTAKVRPDQKVVFTRTWPNATERTKGIRGLVEEVYGLTI